MSRLSANSKRHDRHCRPSQRFRCDATTIQVTEIRLPCDTISVYGTGIQAAIYDARAMKGDPLSDVWGLNRFYAAVVEPGIVRPADSITLFV